MVESISVFRIDRLKGLGNGIAQQVAMPIMLAIKESGK